MKQWISFTKDILFEYFVRLFSARKTIRLQNNLSLISYLNRRYHYAAGVNCQSACVHYLPDRGSPAVRRGAVAPEAELSPRKGRVILSDRAGLGSGVNRTAR